MIQQNAGQLDLTKRKSKSRENQKCGLKGNLKTTGFFRRDAELGEKRSYCSGS
jgi:hypothetical protein